MRQKRRETGKEKQSEQNSPATPIPGGRFEVRRARQKSETSAGLTKLYIHLLGLLDRNELIVVRMDDEQKRTRRWCNWRRGQCNRRCDNGRARGVRRMR